MPCGLLNARVWGWWRGGGSAEPPCRKVCQGWFLSCPLSCGALFRLPGFFPHPLSSLFNCVIIFKQINSIAEFSCPNDEFAAQMPLISHSPENQLMNSTRLSLERHLEQLCMAPCALYCPPSPPTPYFSATCSGTESVYNGRPSVPAKGRMSSQGARPLVLLKQS